MPNFLRGPNPNIERQKIWNLDAILHEWKDMGESAKSAPPQNAHPPSDNHRENLRSFLACLLRLELAASTNKRGSRETLKTAFALLRKSGVDWQVSRNDFLWGELFSRYGHALTVQGEPWLGGFASSLIPRALRLPSTIELTIQPDSLLIAKTWQDDISLSGDWLRDKETLQEPLQRAICYYLLSSDSSVLFAYEAKAQPLELVELRLFALFSGEQALVRRLARFSSLAKKLPEEGTLPHLHALESLCAGKLSHPRDWLEVGEAMAKYLAREQSRRLALLSLAFLSRLATQKRQATLSNFLFHSYAELSGKIQDPYGLLRQEQASYLPQTLVSRGGSYLHLTKELGLLLGKERFEKMFRPRARLELSSSERQRFLELAAQEMTRLKGPVMKLGQMVTYMGTDLSAAERSLFDCLWQDSAPLPFSAISHQLSAQQKVQLAYIDPTPLGCGSVSQVHRARTKEGQELALKILLPGIPELMRADFLVLRTLLPVARWLSPGVPLEDFYQEMTQGLVRETDFLAEADSLKKLKTRFADQPDIRIPDLFPELCAGNTVAMSLERGQRFHDFIRGATQDERDRAGQAIVRFVVQSVKEKFFNSDPHPGNYLFNGPRVTFLDFGAAATWDARTSAAWNGLILAFLHYDLDRFVESMRMVNGISERATKEDIQTALDFFAKPQEGFWNTGTVSSLDADISVRQIQGLMRSFNHHHMPIRLHPKFLFGMRVYLGHLHVVARIGARANWKEIVQEIFAP